MHANTHWPFLTVLFSHLTDNRLPPHTAVHVIVSRLCLCEWDRESETREEGDRQSDRGVVGMCVSVVSRLCVCMCVWVDCILCVSHHRSHIDSWGNTKRDINDDKVYCRKGNPVYLHQTYFTNPLMSWSNIVPMPNLLLQSQWILAFFCSALLCVECWEMACKASSKTQNATCQTARCFDPRWPPESQHGSTASRSQGWIHRHSVSGACQGYLHHLSSCNTTFTSFFSVVVTLNICHLVGALITVQPVDAFFFRKRAVPMRIKPPTLH